MALAIGIVAFALVPMLGLMASGLTTFRSALNSSVTAQIAQRVTNDLQQTDFATLVAGSSGTSPYIYLWPTPSGTSPMRYFDDQANEYFAPFAAGTTPPIYQVQVRIKPVTVMPSTSTANDGTSAQLATVSIQVALHPSGGPMALDTNSQNNTYLLWTDTASVTTSLALISNNGGK